MEKIIIYANGKDRVGIISDITKEISNAGGNIETSKMIKLDQEFNMLVLISIDKHSIFFESMKLIRYSPKKPEPPVIAIFFIQFY